MMANCRHGQYCGLLSANFQLAVSFNTLMGLDFFKRSIEYVEKYRRAGQRILHTMQTNGVLLDDEWCAFFKEHNFLVGLSIDGPREMHDAYRVNKGGEGSFDQVMRAWNAAPARCGGQYPLHYSRRKRRSSARSLPLLSRSVAGCLHAVHPDRGTHHSGAPSAGQPGMG